MWTTIVLIGVLAVAHTAHAGRSNGDPIDVGDTVRIRILVEKDYYFGVVACGSLQCRGVRLEGVDKNGMGYRTFVADIADVDSAVRKNKMLRTTYIIKEDMHFGTYFLPGRQYTFVVSRPTSREMLFWIEGQEARVASVGLEDGIAILSVAFSNGQYHFIDEEKVTNASSKAEYVCPSDMIDNPISNDELYDENADILDVFVGCRYQSYDKVNAMCIVYLAVEGDKNMHEIYRSKVILGSYDRKAMGSVKLPFRFQEQQTLVTKVYRDDTGCDTPTANQLIGTVQSPLSTINRDGKAELSVTTTSNEIFFVNFQLDCEEKITFSLSARDVPGEKDVSLKIMRSPLGMGEKSSNYEEVAETHKVSRDTNFLHWGNITLSVKALCDGDYNRPIKIYALEYEDDGDSLLIGTLQTTLKELKEPQGPFLLIDSIKQANQGQAYNHSGQIIVGEIPLSPTFSQYVAVGFQIVGSIQVDFTGSNNDVNPSLHLISDVPNSYEVAILSVGEVVEKFVADSIFKVYGFGATLPGGGDTSMDFSLNLDSGSPDCKGVQGVLETYHDTVPRISMSGPTHFAPGILKVVNIAKKYVDGSKYFVHLLLTDGLLHDPDPTKEAILKASSLPISIIIVGIGNADFSELKKVIDHIEDGTASAPVIWTESGRKSRDIVQFVAMNEFVSDQNANATKRALRKRVLSKIPPQYLEYMKIQKIAPKPPKGSTITRDC